MFPYVIKSVHVALGHSGAHLYLVSVYKVSVRGTPAISSCPHPVLAYRPVHQLHGPHLVFWLVLKTGLFPHLVLYSAAVKRRRA
jgi:hypothetical protein